MSVYSDCHIEICEQLAQLTIFDFETLNSFDWGVLCKLAKQTGVDIDEILKKATR